MEKRGGGECLGEVGREGPGFSFRLSFGGKFARKKEAKNGEKENEAREKGTLTEESEGVKGRCGSRKTG